MKTKVELNGTRLTLTDLGVSVDINWATREVVEAALKKEAVKMENPRLFKVSRTDTVTHYYLSPNGDKPEFDEIVDAIDEAYDNGMIESNPFECEEVTRADTNITSVFHPMSGVFQIPPEEANTIVKNANRRRKRKKK